MAEAHTDEYLARKMSRAELNILSEDERKERIQAQSRIRYQNNKERYKERGFKSYYNNRETILENKKKFYHDNPEIVKEWRDKYQKPHKQTPLGKKTSAIANWKNWYLQETPEEMEMIYILRETQELCSSCGCVLTRTGKYISTDACMDHCHITNRFRQICCKSCNTGDSWRKFWVDGIYGGKLRFPRAPPPQ